MGSVPLSVIVPTRDQASFIDDALTSLSRQFADPSAVEVLVVDDGSIDGSGDVAASFADRLPLLRVLRNDAPSGVASARNKGLEVSNGRLVAFLDPDDWLAPGHLDRLVREIDGLDVDFVRTDHVRHTSGVRSIHRAPQRLRGVALNPRADVGPYNVSTMVDYCFPPFGIYDGRLRDRGLLHFPAGRHTAEDRPWIWGLHLKAASYAVSRHLGAFYRRGNVASMTQVLDRRQLDFLPCFDDVFRLVAADPERDRFWPKAARQFLAIACHQIGRSGGMGEDYRHELHAGIGRVTSTLPREVRRQAIDRLDAERRGMLATTGVTA